MVSTGGRDGIVLGLECVDGGKLRSKWSSGELVGVYIGIWGSPTWVSGIVLQHSSSGRQ